MPISITLPEGPTSPSSASRRSTPLAGFAPPAEQLRGDIPYRRATAETFASGPAPLQRSVPWSRQASCVAPPPDCLHPARHDLQQLETSITGHICRHGNSHRHQNYGPIPHHMPSGQTGSPWRSYVFSTSVYGGDWSKSERMRPTTAQARASTAFQEKQAPEVARSSSLKR